jgi:uncharacterized membrane protein
MKRIYFYICTAVVALIEVGIFWTSVEISDPVPCVVALFIGIAGLCLLKNYVDEITEDERTQKISQITALRTLQISWLFLFLFAVWIIIEALGEELRHYNRAIGIFGFRLLVILCGIIILYTILSICYNRKYGA